MAEGKIVELSAHLKPAARINFEGVIGGQGAAVFLKILAMSPEERKQAVSEAASDELVVWFAFLTPENRREFLAAAARDLKIQVADKLQQDEDEKKKSGTQE
jgi:hypothetical protein